MRLHDRGNSEKAFFPLRERFVQATRWDTRPLQLPFSTVQPKTPKSKILPKKNDSKTCITHWFSPGHMRCSADFSPGWIAVRHGEGFGACA